jgi:hypothetical protein
MCLLYSLLIPLTQTPLDTAVHKGEDSVAGCNVLLSLVTFVALRASNVSGTSGTHFHLLHKVQG